MALRSSDAATRLLYDVRLGFHSWMQKSIHFDGHSQLGHLGVKREGCLFTFAYSATNVNRSAFPDLF